MTNMTLAVPEELRREMDEHPEINWSEIARHAFKQELKELAIFAKFKERSELTEEDAIRMGREVSEAMGQRYLKMKR